jgi:SAM-dependent methyltransferase
VLFRHYFYLSSFSDTMLRHSEHLVHQLLASRPLDADSLVVEVASNDGYLLQYYMERSIPVLGIEPAENVAQLSRDRGIPTICDFFSESLARRLGDEGKKADIIHAHNVLAHVADLNGTVRGIAHLLKDTGLAVIEVPYVRDMVECCEFDTIYHEHLCYFSLTALDGLLRRHGLVISEVEHMPVHGGTLRIYATKSRGENTPASVAALQRDEQAWRVRDASVYRNLAVRVERLRRDLLELLAELKSSGKRIAAYGASAKGSTLLNCFGIGEDTLDYVVDRNPAKQGHYMPGVRLPICPPERLLTDRPDYVLILSWNIADEILRQQAAYRMAGGCFIVPVPDVRVIH